MVRGGDEAAADSKKRFQLILHASIFKILSI